MPVLPAVPSTMVPPGRKRAARDRVLDDEQRGAVLDRLAGIEEFRLAQNFAAGRLGGAACSRISGVLPIAAMTSCLMDCMPRRT